MTNSEIKRTVNLKKQLSMVIINILATRFPIYFISAGVYSTQTIPSMPQQVKFKTRTCGNEN